MAKEPTKKTNEIVKREERVELSSPQDIINFATSLKGLIEENKLYTKIKNRDYVNVEGWQIAGAFTGIFPVVEKVEQLASAKPGEYKYRAEVSLRNNEERTVGYGVAVCSNREAGKSNFDEYAVASMAQTRAVGKAFRLKIGWLLKLAGYEPTPAEEMDGVESPEQQKMPVMKNDKPSLRDISYAKDSLAQAKTVHELRVIYSMMSAELKAMPEMIKYAEDIKRNIEKEVDNAEETNVEPDGDDIPVV